MAQEIERKFLLEAIPGDIRRRSERIRIQQGYLALGEDGREVRLRKAGHQYWLTVKTEGTLTRKEYETELTAQQFQQLWEATENRRLTKDRFRNYRPDYLLEIDEYHQPLQGLLVAEVEFRSEAAAHRFEPPPWMGREITHLNFLKNKNLLKFKTLEELKARL